MTRTHLFRLAGACCLVALQVIVPVARPLAQSQDVPRDAIPQNTPCADQAKSLDELKRAFSEGIVPSATEVTGSWVAIGIFGDPYNSLNCQGVKRGPIFEEIMLITGYAVEAHVIGTCDQSRTMARDPMDSFNFPFSFGGDANPVYRCKLTAHRTLACLIDVYRQGVEFKKMTVKSDEIPHSLR